MKKLEVVWRSGKIRCELLIMNFVGALAGAKRVVFRQSTRNWGLTPLIIQKPGEIGV